MFKFQEYSIVEVYKHVYDIYDFLEIYFLKNIISVNLFSAWVSGYFVSCICLTINFIVALVCTWGPWGGWSSCSKTCGVGRRNRRRFLTRNSSRSCKGTSQTQTAICNTRRCPGEKEITLS